MKSLSYEKKWWYRLMKVIYIVSFGITFVLIVGLVWMDRPTIRLDSELTLISCGNGKNYPLYKNNIYEFSYGGEKELSYSNDIDARILCKYDTLDYYSYRNEKIEKNYVYKPVYIEPDYTDSVKYLVISLAVAWLLFKLIKLSFFYIVFGESPLWRQELKKIL